MNKKKERKIRKLNENAECERGKQAEYIKTKLSSASIRFNIRRKKNNKLQNGNCKDINSQTNNNIYSIINASMCQKSSVPLLKGKNRSFAVSSDYESYG